VRIATTEAMARVVRELVDQGAAALDGACADYQVSTPDPATVLLQVSEDDAAAPDVWIPDSSLWVDRANAEAGTSTAPLTSDGDVAYSPLVLAVPGGLADRLAGDGNVAWGSLLSASVPVRVGDPGRDTSGMLALLTARSVVGDGAAAQKALGAAMIRLSRTSAPSDGQLFAASGTKLAVVFPTSEQAVASHLAAHPGARMRAVVPAEGTASFDYPFVQLPGRSPAVEAAGSRLRQALTSSEGTKALQVAGFRVGPDSSGPGLAGVPASPKVRAHPTAAAATGVLAAWDSVRTDMRMLAVIDVSGSMDHSAGDRTRIQLAAGSAAEAMQVFPPSSQVGLWEFSTHRGPGGQDWRELSPIERLDAVRSGKTHRDVILAAARGLPADTTGDTALYDTVLAAYRSVQHGYDPHRVNSVVILTDGWNDDPSGGLTLGALHQRLRQVADPHRPVVVITVAMGPTADTRALSKIAGWTQGEAFVAKDPRDIRTVFVEALLQRQCRPNCS
jgi:hypothetical protein